MRNRFEPESSIVRKQELNCGRRAPHKPVRDKQSLQAIMTDLVAPPDVRNIRKLPLSAYQEQHLLLGGVVVYLVAEWGRISGGHPWVNEKV